MSSIGFDPKYLQGGDTPWLPFTPYNADVGIKLLHVDQPRGEIVVPVENGRLHRREAVLGLGGLQIGPRRDQQIRRFNRALARGEEDRGESALRTIVDDPAVSTGQLRKLVVDLPRVHVGLQLDQQLDHVRVVFGNGIHQGGLSPKGFAGFIPRIARRS